MNEESHLGTRGYHQYTKEEMELHMEEVYFGPGGMKELSPKLRAYFKEQAYNPIQV